MDAEARATRPEGRTWLAALVLVAVYTLLAVLEMRQVDATVDEPTYFNTGRLIVTEGWSHPLTRLHGPLPYYLNQALVGDFPPGGYDPSKDHADLLFRGRLGLLPFGWIGALVVFLWSRRLFGDRGALFSLSLYTLNPLIIGYSGLLAVDIVHSASVLLALYGTWRFLDRPGTWRALGVGALLGIAFATKYLALLNGPFVVLAAVIGTYRARGSTGRPLQALPAALLAGLLVTVSALTTLHACYLFQPGFASTHAQDYASQLFQRLFSWPGVDLLLASFPRPFLEGVDYQMSVGEGAHFTPYLNGRFASGHADYYLWSFLRKSPEILILCALWVALRWLPLWLSGKSPARLTRSAWILVPPAALAIAYLSLFTALQIGVRYVLPFYLFLFVACGVVATERWFLARLRWSAAWAVVLALHVWDLADQWPNLIAYINRSSGGQAQAYRYFNDSNSDWGQLVGRGRIELEETETEPFVEINPLMGPRLGRVAVELRYLVRRDPQNPERMRHWVLAMEPERHVGGAWWLFDASPENWERSLRENPDERRRAELAIAYLGAGLLERARPHLEQLGQDGAEHRELHRLLLAHERGEASTEDLLRMIALWTQFGRHDRVTALLEEEPSLADHPRRNLILAPAWMKQGRLDLAIEALEEEDLDRFPRAALMLARYYFVEERFSEARAVLEPRLDALEGDFAAAATQLLGEIEERAKLYEEFHAGLAGGG